MKRFFKTKLGYELFKESNQAWYWNRPTRNPLKHAWKCACFYSPWVFNYKLNESLLGKLFIFISIMIKWPLMALKGF